MNLALFDFDGTLTKKDTLKEFLKFSTPKKRYYLNLMRFLPTFLLYKIKIIPNGRAKEQLLANFFKGVSKREFEEKTKNFSLTKIDTILRGDTFKKLKEHQKRGDRVIIVSASIKCWIIHWAKRENIEVLSTELEFINGYFSGKFLTKNCYGIEKVNRVKEYLNLNEYDKIYAYGDSRGDIEMLKIADRGEFV